MRKITVFDFDGTLTLRDSMMAIIIFQRGRMGLLWALLREVHLLVLMFMGLYSNQKAKEHLLSYCFGGMNEDDFYSFCHDFASKHTDILNPGMVEKLNKAKAEGQEVCVITASPECWVSLFFDDVQVLGSKMEVTDGKITGRLSNRNCYGQEKVERLLAFFPDIKNNRKDYYITAYGDSKGDREMLAFADCGILVK